MLRDEEEGFKVVRKLFWRFFLLLSDSELCVAGATTDVTFWLLWRHTRYYAGVLGVGGVIGTLQQLTRITALILLLYICVLKI